MNFAADKSTKFFLLWNMEGDIIGIVAYWNKNFNEVVSDFLPFVVKNQVVSTILVNPRENRYSFGILGPKFEFHPYRYNKIGASIEVLEFINKKWVKTAIFDSELKAISLEKGKATPVTLSIAYDVYSMYEGFETISRLEQC